MDQDLVRQFIEGRRDEYQSFLDSRREEDAPPLRDDQKSTSSPESSPVEESEGSRSEGMPTSSSLVQLLWPTQKYILQVKMSCKLSVVYHEDK